MKYRVAQLLILLALVSIAMFSSGCGTTESDNTSVRPWNTPQDWEGNALGGMETQHR